MSKLTLEEISEIRFAVQGRAYTYQEDVENQIRDNGYSKAKVTEYDILLKKLDSLYEDTFKKEKNIK